MKVCWKGFLGQNHSWALVAQNTCRELIRKGHQVEMIATDGLAHFPSDLEPNLIGWVDGKMTHRNTIGNEYDLSLSYTAPHNWQHYLSRGKLKFGMWVSEYAGKNALPDGMAKCHLACDKLLTPSVFGKQVFVDSGVPESKVEIVPHGIDVKQIENAEPVKLDTDKVKLLLNLGQVHMRKGLDKTLEAFGKAFSKKDNVCLVIKVSDKQPMQAFELSFRDELTKFKFKFPNHAQIIVLNKFVENIFSIYKACDVYFHLTKAEGFGMPFLEALSCGLVNVAPRYGGQLDFVNDDNALLIDGKQVPCPPKALYWQHKLATYWFESNVDEAVEKLRYAVNNLTSLKDKVKSHSQLIRDTYSWSKITDKIVQLAK